MPHTAAIFKTNVRISMFIPNNKKAEMGRQPHPRWDETKNTRQAFMKAPDFLLAFGVVNPASDRLQVLTC